MRIEKLRAVVRTGAPASGALVVLAVAAIMTVAIVALAGLRLGASSTQSPDLIPADVGRIGLTVEAADASGAIPADQAVEAAKEGLGSEVGPEVEIGAYLVTGTDPGTITGPDPITSRKLWIVRFAGLDQDMGAPMNEDGSPASPFIARFAYVLVDAASGTVLDVQFWE